MSLLLVELITLPFDLDIKSTLFDSGSSTRNCLYTPSSPPLKMDEKCCQKAESSFAKCNFHNFEQKALKKTKF